MANSNRLYLLTLVLLVGPFYLNDLSNIFVRDWRIWLLIDYGAVKFFPFIVTFWLISRKKMKADEFGLAHQSTLAFAVVFFGVTFVGTVIDQNGYQLISALPGYPPLGSMPPIESPFWNWLDLTLGLLMVGVFEELVFRGFMHTFLSRFIKNAVAIVVLSSIAFGLAHWSLGLHAIIITSIIGAVFMGVYMRTKSLPAIMLVHFAVNFIDFSGVIPKSIFRFV